MSKTPLLSKLSWSYTSFNGVDAGSGVLTLNNKTGVVIAMSGTYDGKNIAFRGVNAQGHIGNATFHPNDPGPGLNTLENAPNGGGVNYTYDDKYSPTGGVSGNGLLFSTGVGKKQVFYNLFNDGGGSTQADAFSVTSTGAWVPNEGTFTTTPFVASSAAALLAQTAASMGGSSSSAASMDLAASSSQAKMLLAAATSPHAMH